MLFLYLPLMYMGVQPFLAAVLCCILITLFSMILLGGFTAKTFSAIAGTTIGCVVSGLIAFIFAYFMHINGYNVEEVETLILIEQNSQLQAGGLLFSGILITSLGASMDVAMVDRIRSQRDLQSFAGDIGERIDKKRYEGWKGYAWAPM